MAENLENSDVLVHTNAFESCIFDFCQSVSIETAELVKKPQSLWVACMMYLQRHLIKDKERLRFQPNTNNQYDVEKVNALCDLYIYYSLIYDKIPTIDGFSKLTGISRHTIYDWNEEGKYNRDGKIIFEKLTRQYEEGLRNRLLSSPNIVGTVAVVNNDLGWNKNSQPIIEKQLVITGADLKAMLPKVSETERKTNDGK